MGQIEEKFFEVCCLGCCVEPLASEVFNVIDVHDLDIRKH